MDVRPPADTLIHAKYAPGESAASPGLKRQAAKRVGIRVAPYRTSSWDHRKIAGAY